MRNITLPVFGIIGFPESGTEIIPAHCPGRTLIRCADEEFGKHRFLIPFIEIGEAVQLYVRMAKEKGMLITAEVVSLEKRSRCEWEEDELTGIWPFAEQMSGVENALFLEINGFVTFDPITKVGETILKSSTIPTFQHCFGYLSIEKQVPPPARGPGGVGITPEARLMNAYFGDYVQAVIDFSFDKRSFENLSALCRTKKVQKIDDGKETVFWSLGSRWVVKISNPN